MKKDYELETRKMLEKIEEGLVNISTNEGWLSFLKFNARFYSYSFNNSLLIYTQKPDASYVAGYKKWLELDRFVAKGEKSIKILAPLKYKSSKESDDEEDDFIIKGFRLVNVFDISQTQGSDQKLPILLTGLKVDDSSLYEIYSSLICIFGKKIKIIELSNINAKGYFSPNENLIVVKKDLSTKHKIKTLLHEFAHFVHHSKYHNDEARDVEEIIAESSAFIVSEFLDINTADYSLPYIKSYCNDISKLKLVGATINKISLEIINEIQNMPLDAVDIGLKAINL